MKKSLLFLLVSFLSIIGFSHAQDSCDQVFYWSLRYYKWYVFNDTFNNPGPSSYYIWNYKVDYREQFDYNNSTDFPQFWRTDTIKSKKYEVKKWEDIKFIEAKTPYYIYSVPQTRDKNNLFLKYTLTYSTDSAWTNKKDITECKYYEISWCWDGMIDSTYNETCDNWKNNSNTIPGACRLDCSSIVPPSTTKIDIEKKLINNKPYQSWELVWFRIDFSNKWTWVNHHVIVTDYLPKWLIYVSSIIKLDDQSVIPMFEKTVITGSDAIRYRGFDLGIWKWWYIILTWMSKWVERNSYTTNFTDIISDEWYDNANAGFEIYSPSTILTIDKTINKSLFNLWETVNFAIAVKNNWPTTINWLQIQDIRPDNNCIIYSSGTSDHNLTTTNPNNPYTRTYNQTFNIWETINIYFTWQIKNDINCVRNYLNTWTLTYTILGETNFLRDVVPFSVLNPDNQCRSISVSKDIIKLDSNYRWTTDVSCYTNWWVWNIEIDCWNGKNYTTNNVTSASYICEYNDTVYPKTYTISCKVNNTSSSNCIKSVLIDRDWGGDGWYCWNGRLDSFESCDITEARRAYNRWDKYNGYYKIWDRADNWIRNISSSYDNWRYYCKNCAIRELPWSETYIPQACFNTNTTISVQKWEYLPFRWNLENTKDMANWSSCNSSSTEWKILKDTLKCTFKIYNWKHSDSDEDEVLKITKDCDTDERNGHKLFNYFETSNLYRSIDNAFWKYYLKVDDFAKNNIYWEYKLALDSVKYDYCDENNDKKTWIIVERVCEVDFAVTKPYIAQKSNFNITPKATNLKLEWFYDILGNPLIKKTDLEKIMILDEWQYNASTNVYNLMTSFIKKYDKLAVKIDKSTVSNLIESNSSVQVSKVPNQQIYIFQWNWDLKLKELWALSKPFTMIIKWLNLIVKWNIEKTNWMFLVDWWTISFEESESNRCKKTQLVQWIFITNKWFAVKDSNIYQRTTNDKLDNPRCIYGWLKVKWVLIWNNIESIIMARRSQLNDWFRVNSSNPEAVEIERRNEIFNWASLLIEYSPWLREQLPPWANEFTKSLEIYKK